MIISFIYIFLAILGLGFLVLIHELGHYFMARHVGMKVEAFGIGFGKPIYSFERDGVKWNICWLPFGGYVKIAGMEKEEGIDPYENPNGYFGKKPIDRIKVALAGPIVNIIFAFLAFCALWLLSGREKNFSEYTSKIGWIDPQSELYADGIRPGDEVTAYDRHPVRGFKDHIQAPMTGSSTIDVEGFFVDYVDGQKKPFDYKVKTYPHPLAFDKGLKTAGILQPASYLIYSHPIDAVEGALPEGSPMKDSGIQFGDRVVWVDGELVFSLQQLSHILNDGKALITVKRGSQTILARVPRVLVEELKLDGSTREELTDWQFEGKLNSVKLSKLYTIPYNLSASGVVESRLNFIDSEHQEHSFPSHPLSLIDQPLQQGDQIVAIDGVPIEKAYQILTQLQKRQVHIIVERTPRYSEKILWKDSDADFDRNINYAEIQAIASTIGLSKENAFAGNYHLLNPVTPKNRNDIHLSPENQAMLAAALAEQKKEIEAIQDPEKKAHAKALLESSEKQLLLGLPGIQDRKVNYNPSPFEQFGIVFDEIQRTLVALITGSLNPKWISGPVGIVQVVQQNWMLGYKEALFWLGAISLNLGLLNLLPLPVLDGGYICLSLFEMITRKRIQMKVLEKLIIPFALLLIGFMIFLTYNDLLRIFSNFFK
jgi:regulator of sigma E protease